MAKNPSNLQKVVNRIINGSASTATTKNLPKPLSGSPIVVPVKAASEAAVAVKAIIDKAIAKHGADNAQAVGNQVASDMGKILKKPVVEVKPMESTTVKPLKGSGTKVIQSDGMTSNMGNVKNITYVKKGTSAEQAASSQRGLNTARSNKINAAGSSAKSAAAPVVSQALKTGLKVGSTTAGVAAIPAVATAAKIGYDKGKASQKKTGK